MPAIAFRVIAETSLAAARKMHGPSRSMLLAKARAHRNNAGFQSYLQGCLDLQSLSGQNRKLLNSDPANKLKSTSDIAPHLQNFKEQHPIWTSATNFKAQRSNCEETGNLEENCLCENSLQFSSLPCAFFHVHTD